MKEQTKQKMQLSHETLAEFNINNSQTAIETELVLVNGNAVKNTSTGSKVVEISDEVLKTLINLSTDIITVLSPEGIILYESESIELTLGYKKDELIGMNAFSFIHKDDVKKVISEFETGFKNPGTSIITLFRFRKADGTYSYLESTGTNFNVPHNNNVVIISRDVTARIENEKKISRLTAAVEQSSNTVVITDIDGNIEYVNKKFADLTGYNKDEIINGNPRLLSSGETSAETYKDLWTTILTGKVWEGELRNKKKSGQLYWERIKITPVVDENDQITNFIAIKDDVTSEKQINEMLAKSLLEKEIMLKEIHHRVKNNLQIVISLLSLQSNSVNDLKLKNQLTISQNRVRSMALIHQLLYKSSDLSSINMDDYLMGLSSQLLTTYNEQVDHVRIKVNAEKIFFTIETAVPFGLLVNELVTNSLKHGFPAGRKGIIEMTLLKNAAGEYELNYFDDGIGIPMTVVNGHSLNFGMHLIDMLVKQLDGRIELKPLGGTEYKINFRGSNYQSRLRYS
ncbi:MAG: PAS domain S-box protein [Ignavibacteria bacterium]